MPVTDIKNGGVQARLVVEVAPAASFDPPVLADRWLLTPSLALRVSGGTPLRFELLEPPRTPGFELDTDLFGVQFGRNYDVQVVRAAVDGVQYPAANGAVVGDGLLYEISLLVVEDANDFAQRNSLSLCRYKKRSDPNANTASGSRDEGGCKRGPTLSGIHRDVPGFILHALQEPTGGD